MQAELSTSGVEPAGDWTHDIVRQQRKGIVVVPGACSYNALADHGHQQCGNLDGQHDCACVEGGREATRGKSRGSYVPESGACACDVYVDIQDVV
jgi:hypothetical protein